MERVIIISESFFDTFGQQKKTDKTFILIAKVSLFLYHINLYKWRIYTIMAENKPKILNLLKEYWNIEVFTT